MADSINVDIGYFDHIKTVRLVGALGRGAESLPIRLWCYLGMHPKDNGRLTDFTADDIESVVFRWWGDRGAAVDAMVRVGYLGQDDGGFFAAGWLDRNGHIPAFHERASKAATARWSKAKGPNAPSNATSIPKQCPTYRPTYLPTDKREDVGKPPPPPKASRPIFKPPTPGEVDEFIRSGGYVVDPQRFLSHYESNGWKVGRNPMRDWKAAVRNWHLRDQKGGFSGGPSRGNDKPIVGSARPVAGKYANTSQRITVDGAAGSVGGSPGPEPGV